MRIALAQLNPVVGDLAGNADAIRSAYAQSVLDGAQLVVTPELSLCGYPPEDLLLKEAFVAGMATELDDLARHSGDVPLLVGFVERLEGSARSDRLGEYHHLANAVAVLRGGRIEATYRKQWLPNYGVFDERRYFTPGDEPVVVDVDGVAVGVTVCEDLWGPAGPTRAAAAAGARVVVNCSASPYTRGKRADREHWARHHATTNGVWLAWLNAVGGQDDVVFDGDSFVIAPDGRVAARGSQFTTDLVLTDVPEDGAVPETLPEPAPRLDPVGEVYSALVLATRDYVRGNGFPGAIVGASGGIDSALVAAIAADALGADQVITVAMPSPHSSPGSLADAEALAANLGTRHLVLPIDAAMTAFAEALAEPFEAAAAERADAVAVAAENIQSRSRGVLLMALSNALGHIVLTTGNKSEYAVGYATLYGDMAGGFAPIKDVAKTLVAELCRWRNAAEGRELVPQASIEKPPSAELRPGQLDTDSLPPYDELDPILEAYVELDRSVDEIVAQGHDAATVARVVRLVDGAEYKRRQSAPGPKITRKAFGKDRRLPITQAWSTHPHPLTSQ